MVASRYWLRRALVGPPLRSAAVHHERMRKLVALADPLLRRAVLGRLRAAGDARRCWSSRAAARFRTRSRSRVAIGVLMLAVGLSYRQTVRAYPNGGGSYTVASENLGELPGLFAAAGLMIDYVLTVAVSIASGIAAVTSAIPSVGSATVVLGLVVLALLFAREHARRARGGRGVSRRPRTCSCWRSS